MGRPHVYGFAWEADGDREKPVLRDFQGHNITETLGDDAYERLNQVGKEPGIDDLIDLREYLVDLGVFPPEGELINQNKLNDEAAYLSGPVLRERYHHIVDRLFPEEQKNWESSPSEEASVIVSELTRGRQLMQGDRPMSMVEAVRDFLDMGPYGAHRPSKLLEALDELNERIEAYLELPAPYDIDKLITDSSKMGLDEMMKNPDWIQDNPSVDAEELRKSFGPEPL